MTIKDKTVLVTGANLGIGQPLPHPDDRVMPLSLDVTSTAQIQAAASQIGLLDMLINKRRNQSGTWHSRPIDLNQAV